MVPLRKLLLTSLFVLGLGLALVPAAQAVPFHFAIPALPFDPYDDAQAWLNYFADTEPFPEGFPVEHAVYNWTPEGTWSDEPTEAVLRWWGPDRDDHIIVMMFPPELLTGNDDLRLTVSLVAAFEDIAASLAPVPEPGTWVLVGSGLVAVAGRWVWRRRSGAREPHPHPHDLEHIE